MKRWEKQEVKHYASNNNSNNKNLEIKDVFYTSMCIEQLSKMQKKKEIKILRWEMELRD